MATSGQIADDGDESCPECDGRVVPDGTETVCDRCGLVVSRRELEDKLPRTITNDAEDWGGEQHHTVMQFGFDGGLGSEMGHATERDGDDERRRRWNRWAKAGDHRNRQSNYALGEVHRIGKALELDSGILTQAKSLFRQVRNEKESFTSWNLDAVAAACVYALDHQLGLVPEDLTQLAPATEG